MKKTILPKTTAHSTPDYNHEWYRANASYKRLCSRLHRRANACTAPYRYGQYRTAIRIIQEDRRDLVARGKWVDERTGSEYLGITPRTYVQLTLDLTF